MVTPDRRVGDRSEPVKPDDSYSERLDKLLHANFGSRWRQTLTLHVRGDVLSWLIRLAEVGLQTKATEYAADRTIHRAEAVASLADWGLDIKAIVEAAEAYFRREKLKGR
jgi:hypothetical protein